MINRPSESISSAEVARWMEEDFWAGVVEAAEDRIEDATTGE